jgi:EAL domain-containing protein (putative c-di-GMP-specific phosphodiesterase class I)
MDDFGTGFCSLSYLRTFPLDKIKIDRSFIGDLEKGEDTRYIVSAIIDLASNLGMATTAEGVETEDQLRQLRIQGCNEVQGYLLSVPVTPLHIPKILDQWTGLALRGKERLSSTVRNAGLNRRKLA